MYKGKEILALIPARGGSKSIPKKNILDLTGFPMIAYSIAASSLAKHISRVLVSTDSKEIAEIAKQYGAEIPFLRPAKYATDNARDIDCVKHALSWLQTHEQYSPDYVVFLRPTTPLRNIALVDKAIEEIIKDKKATALRSGHPFESSAYKLFRKKGVYAEFFGKEDFKPGVEYQDFPRQQLPTTYKTNGYVDILVPKIIAKTKTLHGKNIRVFVTDEVPDIDVIKDMKFAKEVVTNKEYMPLMRELKKLKK